jgi:hypothetical protein
METRCSNCDKLFPLGAIGALQLTQGTGAPTPAVCAAVCPACSAGAAAIRITVVRGPDNAFRYEQSHFVDTAFGAK